MSQTISDVFVEHLVQAGVQRIYGIVGDSLNPVVDAVRRNGKLQWIHVRHEEEAAFAAGLQKMLAHPGPVVVDVITDPNALALPPHIEFDQVKGYALSMTRLMLSGRADEVVDILKSNIRDI